MSTPPRPSPEAVNPQTAALDRFHAAQRHVLVRFADRWRAVDPEDCVADALARLRESLLADRVRLSDDVHLKNLVFRVVAQEASAQRRKLNVRNRYAPEAHLSLGPFSSDVAAEVERKRTVERLLEKAETLPPDGRSVLALLVDGEPVKAVAAAMGWSERHAKYKIKLLRETLSISVGALLAWLRGRRWEAAVATAALLIILFLPTPEPSCVQTVGTNYIEYRGDCAIGFQGADHPDLKDAMSPVPGVTMVLHGNARIGLLGRDAKQTNEVRSGSSGFLVSTQPIVGIGPGSYVLLVNRNGDVLRFCEGKNCRDVASGEHLRAGIRPAGWAKTPSSLEASLLSAARLPLVTPAASSPDISADVELAATWRNQIKDGRTGGYKVSLSDGRVSAFSPDATAWGVSPGK